MKRFIAEALRIPLEGVGFIMGKSYDLLFGRYDLRLSKQNEAEFVAEIKREFGFLFDEYGGMVIRDPAIKHPRPFDYASTVILCGDLSLRFFRGRGEVRVWMRRTSGMGDWADIECVMEAIEAPGWTGPKFFSSLSEVRPYIADNMARMMEAFSSENNDKTEREIANFVSREQVVRKQWASELNRRLYPDK